MDLAHRLSHHWPPTQTEWRSPVRGGQTPHAVPPFPKPWNPAAHAPAQGPVPRRTVSPQSAGDGSGTPTGAGVPLGRPPRRPGYEPDGGSGGSTPGENPRHPRNPRYPSGGLPYGDPPTPGSGGQWGGDESPPPSSSNGEGDGDGNGPPPRGVAVEMVHLLHLERKSRKQM